MQNRKTILCYTPSPLPAQNLFFCGFHLDSLFNVQRGERPPPSLLTLKWKTFVEKNAFWGNGVEGGGTNKMKNDFLHVVLPLLHFWSLGHSLNLFYCF